MITIFIVDDHPSVISGISSWLNNTGKYKVTGSAVNLAEAKAAIEKADPVPDIIILDVSIGKEDGLKFIPVLNEICDERKINRPGMLVWTMHEDPFFIQRVILEGADGYVSKSSVMEEITTAIDTIHCGNSYVNPKYKIKSVKGVLAKLTTREIEVLSLVKRNLTNPQIAEQTGLSVRTVENHLTHIYTKTGTKTRAELMSL